MKSRSVDTTRQLDPETQVQTTPPTPIAQAAGDCHPPNIARIVGPRY